MIVASIHWGTEDQEQLKKLPSTIHTNEWLYDRYKTHVKSFHVLQRGQSK